jgi:hypothetical protein
MATGQDTAKRALTIGRATSGPRVVRGATASRPKQSSSGKSAGDHVRQVQQAGNSTSPPVTVQGQRAQPRGKAKAGVHGTAKAVVQPHESGSHGPNTSSR